MKRSLLTIALGVAVSVAAACPASATPTCVREKQPFALSSDTMHWTINIAAGDDCIQGLRWSYMQIYSVSVLDAPSKGKLIVVGPGFRYIASQSDDPSIDKFKLRISGKNRRDLGESILEIEVRVDTDENYAKEKRAPKFIVSETAALADPANRLP
ncbi:hypothetical protein [Bradyrhizobium sp. LTSP857]|jgi:hypothetical protein|uniref:hypothetical protein n=1 Tax=Bradyrhizobium sp. LTSP857 TaxID=1619231 RepID=UPI0007C702EE|nr:hypothetical protein [Bradyrhizobium sp. LTSP857]